jgi:hypothetical protein
MQIHKSELKTLNNVVNNFYVRLQFLECQTSHMQLLPSAVHNNVTADKNYPYGTNTKKKTHIFPLSPVMTSILSSVGTGVRR